MSHGKNKKNFEIFDADEYIARITQHIPDKSFQLVRYYGWYSNRSRGARPKQQLLKDGADVPETDAADIIQITEPATRKIPSKTWRECIKKVWEVDPLECPYCGAEMKIVSFIDESLLIRRILEHLGLWRQCIPEGLPPAVNHQEISPETIVCEEFYDGWGCN